MDNPARARVRRLVVTAAYRAGLRVERLEDDSSFVPGFSSRTTDLQRKVAATPGMITLRRAMYLYWLSYAGSVSGDVIEIGSWQGRSTIALAQGCEDSDNGIVHAIDTFKGNPGHEAKYVIDEVDMSDLEPNFRRNIAAAGLSERVKVYPMAATEAADQVTAESVRMMYIDGDHTYEAVKQELALYADKIAPGGLLTFDDYSRGFEGVAQAIHEHLVEVEGRYVTPAQDDNFLVLRRR